jgi:hypothetical protein
LRGKRLEVVGQDPSEGLALKLNLSGLAIARQRASFCMRVDASEFRAATSCLSGSSDLHLRFFEDRVEICSPNDEETIFSVKAMVAKVVPNIGINSSHRLVLPTNAMLVLTRASRVFPEIVKIVFSRKTLQIFELPPSGRQLLSVRVSSGKGRKIEVVVASRHLRRISEIVRKANAQDAIVSFDKNKPVRLAFRFSKFSTIVVALPRQSQDRSKEVASASLQNLPLFKTCPMVQLISFIGARASGVDPLLIGRIGLDTPRSLNLIQAQKMGLVSWNNIAVALTPEGRYFLGLLRSETRSAKTYLHDTAMRMDPLYRKIMSILTTSPMPYEELRSVVSRARETETSQDMEEKISVVTGIASWCGVVTRKVGLIYSLKAPSIANVGRREIPA